jgi:hypothetical protein
MPGSSKEGGNLPRFFIKRTQKLATHKKLHQNFNKYFTQTLDFSKVLGQQKAREHTNPSVNADL